MRTSIPPGPLRQEKNYSLPPPLSYDSAHLMAYTLFIGRQFRRSDISQANCQGP